MKPDNKEEEEVTPIVICITTVPLNCMHTLHGDVFVTCFIVNVTEI